MASARPVLPKINTEIKQPQSNPQSLLKPPPFQARSQNGDQDSNKKGPPYPIPPTPTVLPPTPLDTNLSDVAASPECMTPAETESPTIFESPTSSGDEPAAAEISESPIDGVLTFESPVSEYGHYGRVNEEDEADKHIAQLASRQLCIDPRDRQQVHSLDSPDDENEQHTSDPSNDARNPDRNDTLTETQDRPLPRSAGSGEQVEQAQSPVEMDSPVDMMDEPRRIDTATTDQSATSPPTTAPRHEKPLKHRPGPLRFDRPSSSIDLKSPPQSLGRQHSANDSETTPPKSRDTRHAPKSRGSTFDSDTSSQKLGFDLAHRLRTHTPTSSLDSRPSHDRRSSTSSTHKVLETLDAKHHANAQGQRMVNQYVMGPLIGKGAYGVVEKGVDVGTGVEYAIKEFSKARLKKQQQLMNASRRRRPVRLANADQRETCTNDKNTSGGNKADDGKASTSSRKAEDDDPLALIRREIAVMKKLDHPNLMHLYEAINVATADSLCLVLEYVPGGTLIPITVGGEPAKPLDPEMARSYTRQLTLGLEYLHDAGIVHRDIKPDNVLLSADHTRIKLCDFGVSVMFDDDDRVRKGQKTDNGSPAFMSPEAATASEGVHSKPVDIWALGVTLYCMLRGRLPFEADNPLELLERIKTTEPEYPAEWDEDVVHLIKWMLKKNPEERATIEDIRTHDWVTRHGTDPMPSTEENLYEIGKQVEEPSEEEVGNAFTSMRASFTVILAIQKMRRAYRRRKNLSCSSTSTSALSTPRVQSPSNEHAPSRPLSTDHSSDGPSGAPPPLSSITSPIEGHTTSPEEIEEGEHGTRDYFSK